MNFYGGKIYDYMWKISSLYKKFYGVDICGYERYFLEQILVSIASIKNINRTK
jgi:hypothetical protein